MTETPQSRYDRANTKRISLKLNAKTDQDVLEHLAQQANVQGYIKRLIRADIAKAKRKAAQQAKTEN